MMKLLMKVAELKGNKNGSSAAGNILKAFGKTAMINFLPFVFPIVGIVLAFFTVTVMFSKNMGELQMSDPTGGSTGSAGNVGTINYTVDDFEECVNVTNSSIIAHSVNDFESHLADTEWKNLSGFNDFIKKKVNSAGFGTAAGVVNAAMAFSCEYSKATGYKYFYTGNFDITMREGHEGIVDGSTYLDCRAFVQWAVYNGGFYANELNYIGVYGVANIAPVKSDVTKVQPGDIFSTPDTGHTWLVVGVYDNGYYAAEEYGYGNGLVINKYSFDDAYAGYNADLYDMSGYYSNHDNVRT